MFLIEKNPGKVFNLQEHFDNMAMDVGNKINLNYVNQKYK
jgi:hypothetical protein